MAETLSQAAETSSLRPNLVTGMDGIVEMECWLSRRKKQLLNLLEVLEQGAICRGETPLRFLQIQKGSLRFRRDLGRS